MIKATLLIILSFTLGLLVGLGIRALAPEAPVERTINVPVQVISKNPLQAVQTTTEMVISIPHQKASRNAFAKDEGEMKEFICGDFEESHVGGSYRRCEWK